MIALEGLGEVRLVELAGAARPTRKSGEYALRHSMSLRRMVQAVLRQTPQRPAHSRRGSMRTKHSA